MDLSVAFLGTGGSVPTARRATACLLVMRGGDRLMFDCGEGSQRQMHRSLGLVQLDEIYLTHLHLDHFLGVPGLLKTYDLQSREAPLKIYGPPGTKQLFAELGRLIGKTRYEVTIEELAPEQAVAHDGYEVRAFPVEHRMKAFGYRLAEADRPGRFDKAAARAARGPRGPLLRRPAARGGGRGLRRRDPPGRRAGRPEAGANGRRSPATPRPASRPPRRRGTPSC